MTNAQSRAVSLRISSRPSWRRARFSEGSGVAALRRIGPSEVAMLTRKRLEPDVRTSPTRVLQDRALTAAHLYRRVSCLPRFRAFSLSRRLLFAHADRVVMQASGKLYKAQKPTEGALRNRRGGGREVGQ
jgi:hypothetical protein